MARRIGGNPRKNRGLWTGYPLAKSPPDAPATDPVPQRIQVTAQQDARGWQEVAGYALLFSSALMPNANTVAAAEYQVGTHQAAIAASQDRSWVRGTPFTLIPSAAGDVILRPTKVAAPEQVDGAYALHWSPPLTYLARVGPTATTLQAGEQTDGAPYNPAPWVHGTPPTLFPVAAGDTLPPRTLVTLPQYPDGAYALTFGPQPAPLPAGASKIAGTVVTYLQPDAERPSWVRLISETLIPPPTPPAVGGGPFGWVEYRKERKDTKPEPEETPEVEAPSKTVPKTVQEPAKAPEKPKRKPKPEPVAPVATPDLSGLAQAFGELHGFPDFLAEIARRKAQEDAAKADEALALEEAAARLEALLAAEAFERKKRAAALAIILTLAAA